MFTHAAFRLFDTTYPAYRVFMLLTAIAKLAERAARHAERDEAISFLSEPTSLTATCRSAGPARKKKAAASKAPVKKTANKPGLGRYGNLPGQSSPARTEVE